MELVTKKKLLLYSGTCHPALAEDIATHLGVELGEPNLRTFPNGDEPGLASPLQCRQRAS